MKTVLITGGGGFIGSFLSESLVRRGVSVRVFDNFWRGSERNLLTLHDKIDQIIGDIRDPKHVREAMEGVDVVYHLASIQGTKFFYEYPDLVLETGLLGSLNVAKAAGDNGVERVIYTSSSEVYGEPTIFPTPESHQLVVADPSNPRWSYSTTKIAGEVIFTNFSRKLGFASVVLRIHNAYGPRMGWQHVIPEFCRRLVLGEEFVIQGDGSETRSFCFVSDVVDGMIRAGERNEARNETFNLGNDTSETSINELAQRLMDIAGASSVPRYVPRAVGSSLRRKPDISKIRSILGYEPRVSIDEGLAATFSWYKKEIDFWLTKDGDEKYPWSQ